LVLVSPALSAPAWSRSGAARAFPTDARQSWFRFPDRQPQRAARRSVPLPPLRLAPLPGLPGKLALCGYACGPEPSLYSRPPSEPLSNTPAAWRGPALDPSAPLEGPFPSADDPPPFSVSQRFVAALPMFALYGGITTWAYFAWYHNQPKNRHLVVNKAVDEGFDRFTYAGGADKTGHFYTNYVFARLGAQILIDRGWSRLWAVLVNVTFTLTLYTLIEVRDGLHPGYGFSVQDYAANVLGGAVAALLLLVPALDRLFDVRMLYRPSRLYLDAVRRKQDIDVSEDYTGETVMLAFHLGGLSAIRKSPTFRILRYVDLLIGYNASGFLPRPDPSVLRKQELFFGFSLNVVEILRDLYPNGQRMGWAAKGLADLSEYVQLTPVHKAAGAGWRSPQPYSRGY
jgi:hypothetical protein